MAILDGVLLRGGDLVILFAFLVLERDFLRGERFVCILGATDFIASRVDTCEVLLGHRGHLIPTLQAWTFPSFILHPSQP